MKPIPEMLRPQIFEGEDDPAGLPDEKPSQAVFWHSILDARGAPKYTGHFGDDPGAATFMAFDPEAKIGVLGFVNLYGDVSGDASVDRALRELMHRFFAERVRLKGN